jgi:hypothetical protein
LSNATVFSDGTDVYPAGQAMLTYT